MTLSGGGLGVRETGTRAMIKDTLIPRQLHKVVRRPLPETAALPEDF